MKILGAIESVEFSDEEKNRLGLALAQPDSLQRKVFGSKCILIRDSDFWRRAQKNFHITGFRDGSQLAKQQVLKKALEAIRSGAGKTTWLEVGPLYVKASRIHIEHELPNLYQLLRTEDFVAGAGTHTEQIFRCICRALPMHEASLDEAKELYDLWGFERTPQIDEILSSISIRADDVRRMVAESIGTARREIAGAVGTARADFMRELEKHSTELANLESTIERLHQTSSETSSQMADLRSKQAGRATAEVSKQHSKPPDQTKAKTEPQDASRIGTALELLQGKVEGLTRQLREQRTRIDSLQTAPVRRTPAITGEAAQTTAKLAIEKWLPSLKQLGLADPSVAAGWLLLQVIRHARVLITDKPEALEGLWRALAGSEVKQLVASPLWISEQDWKAGLDFLSDPDTAPRLLVLHDFDVAIQETYLVPALVGWIASQGHLSSNRILLVPSNNELADVSPRVFELATLCTKDVSYIRDIEKLASSMKDIPPTLELKQSSSAVLGYERLKDATTERELRAQVWQAGVFIPTRIAEAFVSLYEGLQASLSDVNSASIAQSSTLLPWVKASKGETVAKLVQNAFAALYAV
jgi:hypothetical protein